MNKRGKALSVAKTAQVIGKSVETVYRLINKKELTAYRLGKAGLTVYEKDLEKYIEQRRV